MRVLGNMSIENKDFARTIWYGQGQGPDTQGQGQGLDLQGQGRGLKISP